MTAPSRRDLMALLLLALSLGLVVAWASLNLRAGTRADTLYNLHAVLEGAPFRTGDELRANLPFYNRVLFPLLHRGLMRALPFMSESQSFSLLRILAFQAAFAAFALVCRFGLGAARPRAALATALLAVATVASFDFPWRSRRTRSTCWSSRSASARRCGGASCGASGWRSCSPPTANWRPSSG